MKKRTEQLLLCLALMATLCLHAQEKKPLSEVVSALEKKHAVTFNYPDDLILGIHISPPNPAFTLTQALQFLEKATPLSFEIMAGSLILVKRKNSFLLCGYLKDKASGEPLASATVQTSKSNAVSDANGYFQIETEDERATLDIRFLGYKSISKTFQANQNGECFTVYLSPDFQSLSEVLIANYLTAGISKLSDGSFEIDFARFDILPGLIDNDVLQAVQAFPGILSTNETVSNLNVRGGSHDQNLILWDGIKMYQSGHFFGLISMYNPQITQNVSLQKNGSGAAQTDGVSGTISLRTADSLSTEFQGNAGLNLIDANVFVDFPIGKKSSLQVAARKGLSDFVKTPVYNIYFDRISQNTEVENNGNNIVNTDKTFDFHDMSFRWLYKISDKDALRVNFIMASNALQFTENAVFANDSRARESSLEQNSLAAGIHYNRSWSAHFQSSIEVYETDYKLKAVNVNVPDFQRFLQENKVSETSVKLKLHHALNENFQLLNGYHFVETEITNLEDVDNPLFRFLVSEVLREHSGFTQLGYQSSNKNTVFKAGLRFNYIEKFKKQLWEPRFIFTQKIFNDFTVEVLAERKHQSTSQLINFQNDFLGIEKRRWQLSNDADIPVIKSRQFSVGLHFNHKNWLLGAEGYYKKVDGLSSQSQGFQNQFEFEKSNGSYEAKGLDFLFRKKIKRLNLWATYAFMDNDYRFPELAAGKFPSNFDIEHAVSIGSSYSTGQLKIAAGLKWHSGKPTTQPVDGNEITKAEINYAAPNSSRLPAYVRADLSARYQFELAGMKCEAGAAIWNILDRKNIIERFYRIKDGSVQKTEHLSLGIVPNVSLRVYF